MSNSEAWGEPRLKQAFQLIDAVLNDHPGPSTVQHKELSLALDAISEANYAIEEASALSARGVKTQNDRAG